MQKNHSTSASSHHLTQRVTLFALAGFITMAGWFSQQTVNAQSTPVQMRNLEYARVGGKSLLLDLYLPPSGTGSFPLIVWVHGGGWVGGDRSLGLNSLQVQQTARGYAVASISYRLSYEATFPAQIEDCKAAIRWLRANAAQYQIDPNRIGVWGSSAGGHLVALLGTSGNVTDLEGTVGGNLQYSSRVQAVIDWYGPTHLRTMASQSLPCSIIDHDAVVSPESLLVGCAIQSCPEKAERASPTTYVTADDPPFLIMHGTNDCLVPPLQSQELTNLLKAAGVTTTLTYLQGAGHGGPEFTSADSQRQVQEFLDQYVKTAPSSQTLKITGAEAGKKKLFVYGEGFAGGAVILLNGEAQATINDALNPGTTLMAKKGGKKIARGQTVMLQVQNPNGSKSNEFLFTKP